MLLTVLREFEKTIVFGFMELMDKCTALKNAYDFVKYC